MNTSKDKAKEINFPMTKVVVQKWAIDVVMGTETNVNFFDKTMALAVCVELMGLTVTVNNLIDILNNGDYTYLDDEELDRPTIKEVFKEAVNKQLCYSISGSGMYIVNHVNILMFLRETGFVMFYKPEGLVGAA